MFAKERLKRGQIKEEDVPVRLPYLYENNYDIRTHFLISFIFYYSTCNAADLGMTVMSRGQGRRNGQILTRECRLYHHGYNVGLWGPER